jgi:hypothetical protein
VIGSWAPVLLRPFLIALFAGTLAEVRVVVTEVTGRGSIRRGALDTADCGDGDRCSHLIERAALDVPPPYRPVPGRPIYHIHADDKSVLVAWRDLAGPLLELVMTTLAGEHTRAAAVAAGGSARDSAAGRQEERHPARWPAGEQQPDAPDLPEAPDAPDLPVQEVQAGSGS